MALLEARGVTVRFGGNVATDNVDLDVEAGHITGLIGPNGAGKTTIFNALCGLQPMASGTVVLDGEDISKLHAHKRARRGLARTFQRLEVFTLLSVRENILSGAEIRETWARRAGPGATTDDRTPDQIADELVTRLGLSDVADDRVDSLPTGRARLVELGRALANRPRLILLDEVSSGLNEAETEAMAEVLRGLAGNGIGILLVEHDMSLVMSTCEDIHVLDFGQIIAVGSPDEIQTNERVQEAYLGSGATPHAKAVRRDLDREEVPLLDVREISAGYGDFDVLDGVSFSVRTGRGLRPARAQRGGQVHHAEGHQRPAHPHVGQRGHLWPVGHRGRCRRAVPGRALPGPGRQGHLPEPDRGREPGDGHLHRHQPGRHRGAVLRPLPPTGRAPQPGGGDAVGRRAADAVDGPGPVHRAQPAAARRAVHGPGARSSCRASTSRWPRSPGRA